MRDTDNLLPGKVTGSVVPGKSTMSVVVPDKAAVFEAVPGRATEARLGGLWGQCFMCDPRPFFLKNLPQWIHGS